MPVPTVDAPRPRKPRPSRARGLRATTGCLTCRKRRVKCDECKPRCGQCLKSERECLYGAAPNSTVTISGTPSDGQEASQTTSTSEHHSSVASVTSPAGRLSISDSPELRFDLSPSAAPPSLPSPNSAPFEWYDLLAEDAVNNIQRHNLGFDEGAFSRRQSPVPETEPLDPQLGLSKQGAATVNPAAEPWNSPTRLHLTDDEIPLFRHFVDVLGPVMDLYDPLRHFTMLIPRIAVHNLGVMKSLLAVASRHMALHVEKYANVPVVDEQEAGPGQGSTSPEDGSNNPLYRLAVQYYYETLHYLSQNLLYPSYNKSAEIVVTAILISTYEMFDAGSSYSNGDWERHLHGIFWIQRSQNNNGESTDGLRRAAWWAWLRQDIWVAFRESRRTLTIWRPTKRLMALTPDELALRITYIAARCVDFAANEKRSDINIRIDQGDKLLQALEDWHSALPPTFQPIYAQPASEVAVFPPVWIHPPSYAAAVQTFHFARIVTLINQPSLGGMNEFRHRQRYLDESVDTICGIAAMHNAKDLPSSFVDVMSVYAAGLCVQNPARQSAVVSLLEKCLDVSKFPPKTLLDDLKKYWEEET